LPLLAGGFIGSEIAAALAQQGKQVTLIFPEAGIGSRLFPADLSNFLNDYYRQKGVDVQNESSVSHIAGSGTDLAVTLDDDWVHRVVGVHGVVAGIGVTPNTRLAKAAGLEVGNGICVNEKLQTSNSHIFAAGDVANYPDALLGTHRRVEHEDAANAMGQTAGRIMAGAAETYDYSPMFYSDLFDLGYEAVGELDSRMETVSAWKEPYHKGIIAYHENGRVRGILLWNVWGKVDAARQLLASNRTISTADLQGYLS
jgi:3-phenylpropionate/trans-cinnamate dioxygenase ferredoxin reductase subunit